MTKALSFCVYFALSLRLTAATGYLVHNLVADAQATGRADFIDPRIVNAWGLVASATSPFWTCNAGTGTSTVYTVNTTNTTPLGTPNPTLQPTVPGAGGIKGACTGIVANIAPATTPPTFPVTAPGRAAVASSFIFVTEDGVLSAWANGADPAQAIVQVDNSSTAVYKGLAIATSPAPRLYAANFRTGGIDVFDANFKPVTLAAGAFTDSKIPAGFAPFNIWNIGGNLYVAYARQDQNKKFDVAGVGNGFVNVFDTNGRLLSNNGNGPLISNGLLNSPWGLAIAPASFGQFAGALLVGNFGDGLIIAYDATTGAAKGTLKDDNGADIRIPGLWALVFGNGANGGDRDTLYFTAGPGGQQHGLIGSISANPVVASTGITNAAQSAASIAEGTYITIKGTHLAPTKRAWRAADFTGNKLPTSLDGVSVTVNGQPAYISYVSPVQINLLTPANLPTSGTAAVEVSVSGLTSARINVTPTPVAPSFFLFNSDKYIAATHANGSLIGPTTLFPNASTPAVAGETIVLYGNGFGATNPAATAGEVLPAPAMLATMPTILFNGIAATIQYAGMTATGLYQFNVVVPTSLPEGDAAVVAQFRGMTSPAGAFITIRN